MGSGAVGAVVYRLPGASIQAKLLPQPGRPIGGDAIHAGAGEPSRLGRRIDGPDVQTQAGAFHLPNQTGVKRALRAQVKSVESGLAGRLDEFFGRGAPS